MVFKQLLQAGAIDVCQIDSCRLAGVSEVLSVLLMAAKYAIRSLPVKSMNTDHGSPDSAFLYARTPAAWASAST